MCAYNVIFFFACNKLCACVDNNLYLCMQLKVVSVCKLCYVFMYVMSYVWIQVRVYMCMQISICIQISLYTLYVYGYNVICIKVNYI